MKTSEIIDNLKKRLPTLTPLFSAVQIITSLTTSAGIATAITATAHSLALNETAVIEGAQADVAITALTRSGTVGSLETTTDHDVTNGLKTIIIAGANESEFNGTFNIIQVQNRRNLTFTMIDLGPTVATGTLLLVDGESPLRAYNGLQTITSVPTTTSFTFSLGFDLLPATGSPQVQSKIRISGAAQFERALRAYTKQPTNDLWMWVVLGDTVGSKDRNTQDDAITRMSRKSQGQDYKQSIIQSFSIYVFIPTKNDIAARAARDLSEDLFVPINNCILFFSFDSGLKLTRNTASTFVSHGVQIYNAAFYVHAYNYEQVVDLTYNDTVGDDPSVAFRDITFSISTDPGTQEDPLINNIDLDDEPLP